ncbi:uncharacterized protein BDR25DRAFT_101436 [Lindgomyces ingoldianus]|uniref:Uncharacterized protein n=1 Tax=Lindgomyces ingoldianus TaxID=673940 RepID=A0ACB6R979_9PLEO|nr:uncharacterized protein BDR25DRAFT_101436 [Lindgomyces ingoldianus]KAF2475300.1 hypothetical protein BDR25DRAFT_101436 [Lindgomyces ingoldianus]
MLLVRSLAVFALLLVFSVVSCNPFRPRGYDTIAPYANLTSISTAPAVIPTTETTAILTENPPYPIPGTGTGIVTKDNGGRPKSTDQGSSTGGAASKNDSMAPCTVNIPQANIDWWYAATYEFPIGTLTKTANPFNDSKQYLTKIPNTETFDVTSALSDIAYTNSLTYDPEWNITWTYLEQYDVTPKAEITSVIPRTAALPLPSGDIIPATDAPLYDIDINSLPAASLAITGPTGTVFIATSTTPVLYFSVYEVETAVPSTAADGKVTYDTTIETFNLPDVYAYSYDLKGIEDYAIATGAVPDEFLQQIPQSACSAGLFEATVTVLVVVDLTYINFPGANPFIVHIESSVLGFEDETSKGPNVVVVATPQPQTSTRAVHPPMIEHSEDGFSTSVDDSGGDHQAPTTTANGAAETPGAAATPAFEDSHNAGGNQAQGPNAQEPSQQSVGTIGSETVKVGPSSVVVVGSQTLKPGGPAITVGGIPVSLVPSATAIVVGGTTSALPRVLPTGVNNPAPPILTVGSSTFTANAATQFFIGPGQTLTLGGTVIVDGTVVSLGQSASFVVVGGSTQVFSSATPAFKPPAATARPTIVVAGSTVTANPGSSFIIGSQTLAPGQQITVDGSTVSLAPSASFVVINGQTSSIVNPAAQITPPPITLNGAVFTALPGTGTTYSIGGQFLTPGGVITVGDQTVSLAAGATALVVNGQTTTLLPQAIITNAPLLTVGSKTYTAQSGAGTIFIISGQTLTPGGIITVDGTTISLAPGATQLIYGSAGHSTTETLFPATITRSQSNTGATASVGATRTAGGAAATSSKKGGGGYAVQPSRSAGWSLFVIIGVMGLVLG